MLPLLLQVKKAYINLVEMVDITKLVDVEGMLCFAIHAYVTIFAFVKLIVNVKLLLWSHFLPLIPSYSLLILPYLRGN